MGFGRGPVESVVSSAFWRDRPTLVTGATGLVGAWLVRRLIDEGADVVCLVRDWVPQSELVRDDLLARVRVVRGDVRDQALGERVLAEYEVDTVFHLAAQTIVGIANRNPISTFETNMAGTWALLEACRRNPTVKQIVVASSDKAYGDHESCPTPRTRRCKAGTRTTSASRAPTSSRRRTRRRTTCRSRSHAAGTSTAAAI